MNRQEKIEKQRRREEKRKVSMRILELADECRKCKKVPSGKENGCSSKEMEVCKPCWVRKEMRVLQRVWRDEERKMDKEACFETEVEEVTKVKTKDHIVELLDEGKSQSEIARELNITQSCVTYHVKRMNKQKEDVSTDKQNTSLSSERKQEFKRAIAYLTQAVREKEELLEKANEEIKSLKIGFEAETSKENARLMAENLELMDRIKQIQKQTVEVKEQPNEEITELLSRITCLEQDVQSAIDSKLEMVNVMMAQQKEINSLKYLLNLSGYLTR